MKYTIKWCEVKKTGNTNGRDWSITEMTLADEQGVETEKVSTFDAVQNGGIIEGEIVKNDKGYLNFKTIQADGRKPNMDRLMDKKSNLIAEAQSNKAQQISQAQDRSALMWAKYGACEIIAHHPAFKDLEEYEIVTVMQKLSTKIYNSEPIEPFN